MSLSAKFKNFGNTKIMPILYDLFFVIKDKRLVNNLVEYYNARFQYRDFKLSPKEALNICRVATRLNADLWRSINPTNKEEVGLFYRITPFYIFESTYVWMDISHRNFLKSILPFAKGKVLDYGGGIGIASFFLAKKGFDVSYAEVPGTTCGFAKFLFSKNKLNIAVSELKEGADVLSGQFDTIICRDVIEHLLEPKETLMLLSGLLKKNGVLIITNMDCAGPSEDSPMHFRLNFDYEKLLNDNGIYKFNGKNWVWVKKKTS